MRMKRYSIVCRDCGAEHRYSKREADEQPRECPDCGSETYGALRLDVMSTGKNPIELWTGVFPYPESRRIAMLCIGCGHMVDGQRAVVNILSLTHDAMCDRCASHHFLNSAHVKNLIDSSQRLTFKVFRTYYYS